MYRRRRAVQSQQREVAPKAVDGGRDSRRALGAVDPETFGRALDVIDERADLELAGRDAHDVPLRARRDSSQTSLRCPARRWPFPPLFAIFFTAAGFVPVNFTPAAHAQARFNMRAHGHRRSDATLVSCVHGVAGTSSVT